MDFRFRRNSLALRFIRYFCSGVRGQAEEGRRTNAGHRPRQSRVAAELACDHQPDVIDTRIRRRKARRRCARE
jgi:hypothetical protein